MTDGCARRPDVFGIVVKHAQEALYVFLIAAEGIVSHQSLDRRSGLEPFDPPHNCVIE